MALPGVLLVSRRSRLVDVLTTALTFADRRVLHLEPADALAVDDDDLWAAVIDLIDDDGDDAWLRSDLEDLCGGLRARFPTLPLFLLGEPGREISSAADALDLDADGLLPLPTAAANLLDAIAAAHGTDAPRVPRSLVLGDSSREGPAQTDDFDDGYDDVTVPSGTDRLSPEAFGSLDATVEGGAVEDDDGPRGAGSSSLAARVSRLRQRRGRTADVLRDVTERITAEELNKALSQASADEGPGATMEGDALSEDVASALSEALGDDDPSIGDMPIVAASSGSLADGAVADADVDAAVSSMDRGYDDSASDTGTIDELIEDAVEEAGLGVARMALRARRRAESMAEEAALADEPPPPPIETWSDEPPPPPPADAFGLDLNDDDDAPDEVTAPTLSGLPLGDGGHLLDDPAFDVPSPPGVDEPPVDDATADIDESDFSDIAAELAADEGPPPAPPDISDLAYLEEERTPTEGLVTAPTGSAEALLDGEQASEEQASEEQASEEQASGAQASEEQASEEQASGEQASEEQASEEQASEEQASEEQASEEQASEEQASEEQASEEEASEDSAGAQASDGDDAGGEPSVAAAPDGVTASTDDKDDGDGDLFDDDEDGWAAADEAQPATSEPLLSEAPSPLEDHAEQALADDQEHEVDADAPGDKPATPSLLDMSEVDALLADAVAEPPPVTPDAASPDEAAHENEEPVTGETPAGLGEALFDDTSDDEVDRDHAPPEAALNRPELDEDDLNDGGRDATTSLPIAQHQLAAATEAVRADVENQAEQRLRQLLADAATSHQAEKDRLRQELEEKLAEQVKERARLADELAEQRRRLDEERERTEREHQQEAQRREALSEQLEQARVKADAERQQREAALAEAAERAERAAEEAQRRAEEAEREADARAQRALEEAEEAERRARALQEEAEASAERARHDAEQAARRAQEEAERLRAEAEAAAQKAQEEAERRVQETASELEARLRAEAQERITAALEQQRAEDEAERDAAVQAARAQALADARAEAAEQIAAVRAEAEAAAENRIAEALAARDQQAADERERLAQQLHEEHVARAQEQILEAVQAAEEHARAQAKSEAEAELEAELRRQAELSDHARQELAEQLRAEAEVETEARVSEAREAARRQAVALVEQAQSQAQSRIEAELTARDEVEREARRTFEASVREQEAARAADAIAAERARVEAEVAERAEQLAAEQIKTEAERIEQEAQARLQAELQAERAEIEQRIVELEAQLTEKAQQHLQEELARQEEEHQRLSSLLEERVREQTAEQTRAALELHIAEIEARAREEAETRAREQVEALLAQREEAETRVRARLAFVSGRFGAVFDGERGAPGEVGADVWEEGADRTQPLYRIPFSSEGAGEPVEPPEPPPLKPLEPAEGTFGEGEIGALLFAAHFLEVTGRLDIIHEDGRVRSLYLELGEPVAFYSTLARDRSEERLLKAGLLTAAQHAELRAAEPMSARRLCASLVVDGVLKTHELFTAVRGVLTEQLLSVLEWDKGTFRYVEERAPAADRVRLVQRFDALLADGVRRKFEEARLWRVLGGSTSILGPADRAPRLPPLGPLERATVQLIDGTRSLEDITLEVMVPVDVVLRTALILLWCGAAQMNARGLPDSPEARVAEHARHVRIDTDRIRDRLRVAREGDYFQFLGVDREATGYEVERAADQLRQRFDPTRYADPAFADQRAALEEIREVIEDARAVLGDPQLREAYQRNLRPTRGIASVRKVVG